MVAKQFVISMKVILQRHDGSVNFNRTYAEYRDGFGSPFTEMWLGKYKMIMVRVLPKPNGNT